MKVHVVTGDLTSFTGDVVVNAANPVMLGGGGVDGAIHRAAGPILYDLCEAVWADEEGIRCPVGQVRPTPAVNLPCKWVFHTVGPIFKIQRNVGPGESQMGDENPEALLESCIHRAGSLAVVMGLKSIAFPAISTGVYGCPHETCARIAAEWCKGHARLDLDVTFYIYPAEHLGIWIQAMNDVGIDCDAFDEQ